ncbi:hypothetical protein [Candidatus Entotheonella palauensis]|uniref:Zinc-finger domain-containing protein n=1 Tax=Candidatus Entotheonella gemina TaxID=1429439 RepID=W4MAP7_9BACT|nr:hypothetical protein [Candidatus Entotheonella palauensis]ETX06717.1 MAG: hypothetical protein ETSY2_15510 [Candidatus Entotheonella gemina]
MPKTFQEILPALEERLDQAKQGALPIGHAMELRRREKRQAMGCPSDEEIGGFVDGELKRYSAKRWAEVRWHVHQCQPCQDDVEGICEALELDPRDVRTARKRARLRLSRFAAPVAAIAAVLALAVLGLQPYVPTLAGWSTGVKDTSSVESSVQAPALVERQPPVGPKGIDRRSSSTMKVSIPADTGDPAAPVLRVAICSETARPTCGEGMTLMSVMGAECEVTGDDNSCFAKSAAGGCAICLIAKERGVEN